LARLSFAVVIAVFDLENILYDLFVVGIQTVKCGANAFHFPLERRTKWGWG